MNRLTLIVLGILFSLPLAAQKVTVSSSQSEKVRSESVKGYAVELDGKKDDVNPVWIKYLREIGKVRQSADPVTVSDPVFNDLVFTKNAFYTVVREKGEKTVLWLGIIPGEWESGNVSRINNELEKTLYRFGVKYYRDKIQLQIDEAQQALDAVAKQQQRTINQNKDLTIQLSNNEKQKIQLEKDLENNKLMNALLKTKLENNKKAQDSLVEASGQIQKVKDLHMERQRKVN